MSAAPKVVVALLTVVLAGCGRPDTTSGPFAGVWPELRERSDSLLAAGQPDAAARVLRAAAIVVREPYAPQWQRRELAWAHSASARWSAWRASARESLAVAAALVRAARRCSQGDSVGQGEAFAADAHARRLALLGPGDPSTALAALELADLSFRLSRVARTDSLAGTAWTALEHAYGPRHPDIAVARELLGRNLKNYHGRSARPRALAAYQDAVRIRVETLGPHDPSIAVTFHEIGNLERSSGRAAAAFDALRMALALRREQSGPVHDGVASTLTALAILEGTRSHFAAAESLAAAALAASPPGAGTPPMSRAFRLGVWGQLLRLTGEPERGVPPLREALVLNEEAWALSPRDEGTTIQSGLSLHADLALALAETGRATEALAVLERGTSRMLLERSGERIPADHAAWLQRVQRTLAPREALLSWVRSRFGALGAEDPAWAVVIRDHGAPRWFRLPRSTDRLPGGARLRDVFWTEMRIAASWPVRLPGGERDRVLARRMREAWFDPVRSALGGADRLIVCSPELCGGGPLEAFADEDGGWLTDHFVVSYAPSATLHAYARDRSRDWQRTGPVLALGDPAYATAASNPWARLAGSREELAAVSAAFPRTQVLMNAAATAPALRSLAASGSLARFRLLHLATHATVDAAHLLESQLILAPATPGGEVSTLSAREIATQWRIDAELVSLTGCRSASGMSAAAQGWLGFQYAFLRAGARSVLVSLWPVDDAAAALLVREFYARLADPGAGTTIGSRAAALSGARRAVREWRDASGLQPFAHPAYWAGFALIGDPGGAAADADRPGRVAVRTSN